MSILDDATIEGVKVVERFGDAIQHATINRSIDEAPTLTITLMDPDLDVVNSPLIAGLSDDDDVIIARANPRLGMPPSLTIDSNDWVLIRANKQDQRRIQLVFVLLQVYLLTVTDDYRKALRDRVDRLVFCESMCREAGVKFHAPEAGPPAPTFAASGEVPGSTPPSGAVPGFESGVKIRINGAPASKDALNSLAIAFDEAIRLGASEDVMIGMVMSGTGESNWDRKNLNHVGAGHYGIMQQDPRYYTRPDAFHVLQNIHEFLVGGRSSPGGPGTWDIEHDKPITDKPQPGSFMALMKGFTGRVSTIGDIIKRRQGSDASGAYYQQFYAESKRTVAAYQSPDRKREHTVLLANDKYEFTRGQPGKPESTWDCLSRLAAEIGWRRFMVSDTVWFVADEWLFATPALRTLVEASGAPSEPQEYITEGITWSWDLGQPLNELEVSVDDTWIHSPGIVLRVARQGPASGKWLLAEWERDLLEPTGTLRLVKPGQTIPEPVGDQSGKGWKRKLPGGRPVGDRVYPLAVKGKIISTIADHHSRALGNWQSDDAIDLAAPPGTPVYACENCQVVKAYMAHVNEHGGNIFGAQITLTGNGKSWFYTHIENVPANVQAGALLHAGDQIGTVTRWDSAPLSSHLHLGMHPTNVEQYVASLPPPGSTPSAGGGSPSGGFGQSTREKILHWASYGIAYEPKITYTDFIDLPASLTLAKVVADGSPGLDCVTFIELVYKAAGAPDPCGHAFSGQDSVEHTDTLLSHCTHIAQADAKAGDIVVWGSTEINVVAAGGVTGLGHHAAILLEDGPANSNNPWLASHGGNSDPVKIRFSAESAAQAGHSGIQFLRCPGL